MLVAEKQKVLFLLPMKTGTTTIVYTLQNRVPAVARFPQRCTHWHEAVYVEQFKDYCHVLTVRDPVTRMLSLWHQRLKLKKRGEAGINGAHVVFWNKVFAGVNSLSEFAAIPDDSELAFVLRDKWSVTSQLKTTRRSYPDYIIRQEYLQRDFNALLVSHFGLPPVKRIRLENVSSPLEDDSLELAGELAVRFWSEDFRLGGYEMPSNVLV